ncbi:hypothetical protein RHMOL_Rhmol13G0308700 [Rhododendron molle]|uniref:Uncharacterized protein n=1 Tax=Rhododendron molle TaxID=49168 RepID=A0ACC0LCK1_RHOML|nr:hypothetical protein RHMOL_Rhmol13G0308700 [Rhododendron molle]
MQVPFITVVSQAINSVIGGYPLLQSGATELELNCYTLGTRFRCQVSRTSRPLETVLPDPKQNLPSVHPLREYIGRDLTSASNFSGYTHRIPCRFFGSTPIVMQRNPMFSTINADDITKFKEILGEKNVVQDEEALLAANTDWMRKYKGSSNLLLQPRTTEEVYIFLSCEIVAACFTIFCIRISFPHLDRLFDKVSQVLKYCNSRCLAVVPQGGNTGLVGGSVPVFDEVIINMGSMKNIISFDKVRRRLYMVSGILVCEAGCILENLVSFLDNQGCLLWILVVLFPSGVYFLASIGGGCCFQFSLCCRAVWKPNFWILDLTMPPFRFVMPLDLGAKGSCQIGGNVSTNAGGLRFVRYGSLHGNVLGLEAVLANGTVLDMLGTLRKDNTGYDLKHLFIGSEGSLGIISKVSILTPPKLSSVNLAFLACKDYVSCQNLLLEAKRKLGNILSAFEFLDSHSMDLVLNHSEGVRNPLPPSMHNFYVLIETTGSDQSYDKEKLEAFLLRSMEVGLISDGVLAQDINQAFSFWRIREGVPEALMKAGAVYKYDLSLPIEKMYDLVEEMRMRLGPAAKVVGYGHLGDGNLHLNISLPEYDDTVLGQVEPFVYEWTSKHRGSISAEHGLGLMKANKIHYSKSTESVHLMVSIKKLLDPNGILNPYKVLPSSLTS